MKIEELMERRIRRDKFQTIADEILQGDKCYCKEKRGRFDTTYRGTQDGSWREGVQDKLFEKVEDESQRCCQYCGKHRLQIWLETGRVIHICPICYVRRWFYLLKKKIKRWRRGGNGGLAYSS